MLLATTVAFPVVFLIYLCLYTPAIANSNTFQFCNNSYSEDCEICSQLNNDGSASSCDVRIQPCFCLDRYEQTCTISADCSSEEACVKLLQAGIESYCAPCEAIFRRSPLPAFVDDLHNCVPPSPLPTPYPVLSITDDTFESCFDSLDCDRTCASLDDINGELNICFSSDSNCFCVESYNDLCSTSAECAKGTACVSFGNDSNYSYCISCDAINRRSPSPQFVDDLHYCNGKTHKTIDFDKTFKYCGNERLYGMCSNRCGNLRNDGSVSYCGTDTQPCFCLDYDDGECTSSSDCSFEAACVKLVEAATVSYCALCDAIFRRSPLPIFIDDLHDCVPPTPLPTPYPAPSIIDDTFEKCSDYSDCTGTCVSIEAGSSLYHCPDGDDNCFCAESTMPCYRSSECLVGEACVFLPDYSFKSFCASCSGINRRFPTPEFFDDEHICNTTGETDDSDIAETGDPNTTGSSASDTPETNEPSNENEICIASLYLSHLPIDQLVYTSHRRASVLCDQHESCATPGHMVQFDGRYMMMKTYCDINANAICKWRVMSVNSPRMRIKMKFSSNSKGLQFTAMAAKYGTWLEERFVSLLLMAGF